MNERQKGENSQVGINRRRKESDFGDCQQCGCFHNGFEARTGQACEPENSISLTTCPCEMCLPHQMGVGQE